MLHGLRSVALILVAWMGISLALAALIGRAIRSMPHVPLGARPPLPFPRLQVLVPAALGGAFAALAVFAWAAPSLHPGLTRPDVANGRLLPGPTAGPTLAANGVPGRTRSRSRPAGLSLAVAPVALGIASDGVGAPAGRAPSAGGPAPRPSGRKSGGGSHQSISLPTDGQSSAPTPPSQPPAVSEPSPPAPASPAPAKSEQADADWPAGDVARRPAELPTDGHEKASAPGLPGGHEETDQNDGGKHDGDE